LIEHLFSHSFFISPAYLFAAARSSSNPQPSDYISDAPLKYLFKQEAITDFCSKNKVAINIQYGFTNELRPATDANLVFENETKMLTSITAYQR
jgi:hypothetical protein